MTAHAAQGQTFGKGAIVDLNIGGSSSAMSSYVALTRVERRNDLLISRPFPRHLFSQGQKQGPVLLLQVCRKDVAVDWKALEQQNLPRKACPGCERYKYKHEYGTSEWGKKDKRGIVSYALAKEYRTVYHSNVTPVSNGRRKRRFWNISSSLSQRIHVFVMNVWK